VSDDGVNHPQQPAASASLGVAWPQDRLAGLLDEAEAIAHLLASTIAEHQDRRTIDGYTGSILITDLRDGIALLVRATTVALWLDALSDSQGDVATFSSLLDVRAQVGALLHPDRWQSQVELLAGRLLANQALQGDNRTALLELAGELARQLEQVGVAIEGRVAGPQHANTAWAVERFLTELEGLEQADQPQPVPIPPLPPWPETMWRITPDGPAATATIIAAGRQAAHDLDRALRRVRQEPASDPAHVQGFVLLIDHALDAIRRARVVSGVLGFLIHRARYALPSITPVPLATIASWAIAGSPIPTLEQTQKALVAQLMATVHASRQNRHTQRMAASFRRLLVALEEALADIDHQQQACADHQLRAEREADAALASLIHGAAADPRPELPWRDDDQRAQAYRRRLVTFAQDLRRRVLRAQDGEVCLTLVRQALDARRWVLLREAALRQLADLWEAGERPTLEEMHPRWQARTWWVWNEIEADSLFSDAVSAAARPVRIRALHDLIRTDLVAVCERTVESISEALRDALIAEQRLRRQSVDPVSWGQAARAVLAEMSAQERPTPPTVCCDCGRPTDNRAYQCRRCDRIEERRYLAGP
jgi:hypothetical protein